MPSQFAYNLGEVLDFGKCWVFKIIRCNCDVEAMPSQQADGSFESHRRHLNGCVGSNRDTRTNGGSQVPGRRAVIRRENILWAARASAPFGDEFPFGILGVALASRSPVSPSRTRTPRRVFRYLRVVEKQTGVPIRLHPLV